MNLNADCFLHRVKFNHEYLLQVDYVGVIKPLFANGISLGNGDINGESNSLPAELPYSATSLVDHRITLQHGDAVSSSFIKHGTKLWSSLYVWRSI